MQQHKNK